jgi:cytidylate kinase
VVFPDASLKIFLTASGEERARRRSQEVGIDSADGVSRVRADMDRRDAADSGRDVAPLKPASDALVLDGTTLSFVEQVDAVIRLARKMFPSLDIASPQP